MRKLNTLLLLALLFSLPFVYEVTYAKSGQHTLTLQAGKLLWDAGTKVNANGTYELSLFDTNYHNVKSNDLVLAPGTQGGNVIELVNQQGQAADYTMVVYMVNPKAVPVDVHVSDLHEEAVNLPSFIQADSVLGVVSGRLADKDSKQVDLKWNWPYERGQDQEDSQLAISMAKVKLGVYVQMSFAGQSMIARSVKTGLVWQWYLYLALLVISLILFGYFRLREEKS